VPRGAVTLASVLRANGYRTAAFVGSMILQRSAGLDQGFDVYDAPFGLRPGQTPDAAFTGLRRDAAAVTKAAREWLEKNRTAPVFAFLHFYDLHTPYTPPIATGFEPAIAPYDLELAYVDQVLGRFRTALQSSGLWDKSLIILTSDHGEGLGDHGEPGHGYFIYNSTMHVPFIVHWPRGGSYPRRVSEPAGLIDLAPTVLDVLRLPAPKAFKGASLLARRERTIYGESPFAKGVGAAPLRYLVSGPYKYIDAPAPEMYDLIKDPRELVNVWSAQQAEAARMKARIATITAGFPHPGDRPAGPPVSDSTREMLRSLGYTGGGPPRPSAGANESRDQLRIAEALEMASTMVAVKQYGQAVMLLKQVLTWDRENVRARRALAEACKFVPTLPDCQVR
jgi:choline-sulfatase